MLTSLGPFPISAVLLVLALALAAGIGRGIAARLPPPRPPVGAVLLDMLLVGVAAARLGFILRWWPQYAAEPMAILRLGDGGYLGRVGVAAALAFGAWRTRRTPGLRMPRAWGSGDSSSRVSRPASTAWKLSWSQSTSVASRSAAGCDATRPSQALAASST